MAVSRRLRYEILRRDNHQCTYCGATAPDAKLTVDHVVPTALGGSDEPSNLTTACAECNGGKSASSPAAPIVAAVEQDALRWSQAMKQAAEQQLSDLRALNDYTRNIFLTWTDRFGDESLLPDDWTTSAERWFAGGLHFAEVQYGIDVAASASHVRRWDKWKYACGVIYKRLRDRQELAAKLVAQEQPETTESEELTDEEYDRLGELDFDDSKRRHFLMLAAQDSELANLQTRILLACGEAAINSMCEAHEAWYGDDAYSKRFGEGLQSIVTRALENPDLYLTSRDREEVTTYLARLTQMVFETVREKLDLSMVEGRT